MRCAPLSRPVSRRVFGCVVGGIAFSMKNGKSFGSDGLRVLPNYEQWAAIHSLYSDGVTFTLTKCRLRPLLSCRFVDHVIAVQHAWALL
jgi:hypothetical protein